MKVLFWLTITLIAFTYVGYPFFMFLLGVFRRRIIRKGNTLPRLTIVIAAHNEERHIASTIENKLALDYPHDRLDIVVVSDASADRTEEILRSYEGAGVRILIQNERRGKTAALNLAIQHATGEVIVFADANSIYRSDALKVLVANFDDPQIGYVTGTLVYVDETGSVVGRGSNAYMRYENRLRELETRVGSIVGVDGAIDAVRASLYQPMPEHLLPDFLLPLQVIERGYRVVYEPGAFLYEASLQEPSDELKMRVRVVLRSLHTMWYMRKLFNPFRFGVFSVQLLVHKVLRYLVGLLQIVALVANGLILWEAPIYQVTMALQLLFYGSAVAGFGLARFRQQVPLLHYSYYICLLNGASLVALWKFLKGQQMVIWAPRTG